jgi:hypothetical protein
LVGSLVANEMWRLTHITYATGCADPDGQCILAYRLAHDE